MENPKKIIFRSIGVLVLGYIAYFVYQRSKYSYHIDMDNINAYMGMFKEPVKKEIDKYAFVGCVRKSDVLYNYNYREYHIAIWEFKDIKSGSLEYSQINTNISIDSIKFKSGEVLNDGDTPETSVKFGPFFNQPMSVDLDKQSKIDKIVRAKNYKGFYGVFNKLALEDQEGDSKVIIDFSRKKVTGLFLFYRKPESYYIILVFSYKGKQFRDDIINILNLK